MKLLFVIPEYSHGGTNKSLENLLSLIDKTKYQISVYCLYEDGGEYYKKVFAPYVLKKSRLYYWLHDNVWTRKMMGLYNKLTKKDNFTFLYRREANLLQRKYNPDIVVGFQEGITTFFASLFEKSTTIAWYHSPYMSFTEKEKNDFVQLYQYFSYIICVSNTFAVEMSRIFQVLSSKFICIYNSLNTDEINKKSTEIADDLPDKGVFSLLSVGRFAKKSQFHKIPQIAHQIIKIVDKKSFKWYIIASGDECKEIACKEIEKYGIQDSVCLLGPKDNPYAYMKNSDLVVCTSDSESFSYVIAEAKILHTPVISNNFPVAYEVVDEQTGWVASLDDMPQLIARLVNDENGEYSRKKKSIMSYEYSNKEILKQIDELFSN